MLSVYNTKECVLEGLLPEKSFLNFSPGDLLFLHGSMYLVLKEPEFYTYLNIENTAEYSMACFFFFKNKSVVLHGITSDKFCYISGSENG